MDKRHQKCLLHRVKSSLLLGDINQVSSILGAQWGVKVVELFI